jgi:hypothetical protein
MWIDTMQSAKHTFFHLFYPSKLPPSCIPFPAPLDINDLKFTK